MIWKGMNMSHLKYIVAVAVPAMLLIIIAIAQDPVHGADEAVPRISLSKAMSMLGNPDVLFIDVRRLDDIAASDAKIPGAPWENSKNVAAWASRYPKDKTIIVYCA